MVKPLQPLEQVKETFSLRSLLAVIFTLGSLWMAAVDANFRPSFANLASLFLGGYLGLATPKRDGHRERATDMLDGPGAIATLQVSEPEMMMPIQQTLSVGEEPRPNTPGVSIASTNRQIARPEDAI